MSAQAFSEGDRVTVRPSAGRWLQGTVAAPWSPGDAGGVSVVLDGKRKPRQYDASKLTPEKRTPSVQLVEREPRRTVRAASSPPRVVLANLPTVAEVRAAGGRAQPRPEKRFSSPAYLAYVRRHPCCACGSVEDVDAHHWALPEIQKRGMGQKVDDVFTVPLCRACHDHVHGPGAGALPGKSRSLTIRVFMVAQVRLLAAEAMHLLGRKAS